MDSTTAVEINLDTLEKKPSLIGIYFSLFLILAILTCLGFGSGWLVGQISSNTPSVIEGGTKIVTNKDGTKTFTDTANNYSISFNQDFALTEHKKSIPGITLENKTSSLELWLGVDQPVTFSQEQKDAIKTTTNKDLKIDKRIAKATEYVYEAGNYFTVVKLASSGNQKQVTFWLKALQEDSYKQILETAQTFKFD